MSFFTAAELRAWANSTLDSKSDAMIETCISAALDWLESEGGRVLLARSVSNLFLDGDDALPAGGGYEMLSVPEMYRPITFPTGFTAKEDGVTLTVGVGYDPSKDLILRNANSEKRMLLLRPSWSRGQQNVELAFTCGYAAGVSPARVIQALREIAWMFFVSPAWLGKSHASGPGHGITFEKDLTPMTQRTIKCLREGIEL